MNSYFNFDNSFKNIKSFTLNFGPQHPAAHGVLRLILELDGEKVFKLDPHIGLLHRGTEKLMEYKNYTQCLPYLDRLDYVSMMAQEHTYSLAVEKLLNLNIPERSKFIRVIFCEITRILNHLLSIGCHALDVGAMTPMFWCFEEREKLVELYERVSGSRMHANYIRPGGVVYDIPLTFLSDLRNYLERFNIRLNELEDILNNNRIWKQRLVGIGVISFFNAKNWGYSGVMLRSTGIKWDIRKNEPYEIYNRINFNIPISFNGDCFDRYFLRISEMYESTKIINYCIENIVNGPIKVLNYKVCNIPKKLAKTSMDGLIHHFKFFSENLKINSNSIYVLTEAPKGEFGVYLKSDNSNKPYRCRLKAPGFNHLQSLNFISKNHFIADIVTIIGTLDIVFGEVDR